MSFILKIENIAKSSKILISEEPFFSRSKDRLRTHDQKYFMEGNCLYHNGRAKSQKKRLDLKVFFDPISVQFYKDLL